MLKAFFDEASDNTSDFLMAGWLARFDEWERFSDAWAAELKFPPAIEYFNHNEALGNKDQFKGWTDSARDKKMEALANVIARYSLVGLVGSVEIPRITKLFSGSKVPKKPLRKMIKFTDPYHYACQGVVAVTLGYQVVKAKNVTDQVDFIFDEGVPYLNDIIWNYPRLKKILPVPAQNIAGTIISGNDRKIVALQAADLLAGQKLLEKRIGNKPAPLSIFDGDGRINEFSCHGKAEEGIPRSIEKINAVWELKELVESINKQRRKIEHERKNKK
jgi:hypothetical protein